MAALTLNPIVPAGVAATFVAAGAGGDTIADDGSQRSYIEVVNGSGASINVTVTAVETTRNVPGVGNITIGNRVVAVAAGARRKIGPFTQAFRDSSGNVAISYSATATITVAAFRLPLESNQ